MPVEEFAGNARRKVDWERVTGAPGRWVTLKGGRRVFISNKQSPSAGRGKSASTESRKRAYLKKHGLSGMRRSGKGPRVDLFKKGRGYSHGFYLAEMAAGKGMGTGRWVTLKSGFRVFIGRPAIGDRTLGVRTTPAFPMVRKHMAAVLKGERAYLRGRKKSGRLGKLGLAERRFTPAMVERFQELVKAGRIRGMKLADDGRGVAVDKQAVLEMKAPCSEAEKGLISDLKKHPKVSNPHALLKWMLKHGKKKVELIGNTPQQEANWKHLKAVSASRGYRGRIIPGSYATRHPVPPNKTGKTGRWVTLKGGRRVFIGLGKFAEMAAGKKAYTTTSTLGTTGAPGRWVTIRGRRIFIPTSALKGARRSPLGAAAYKRRYGRSMSEGGHVDVEMAALPASAGRWVTLSGGRHVFIGHVKGRSGRFIVKSGRGFNPAVSTRTGYARGLKRMRKEGGGIGRWHGVSPIYANSLSPKRTQREIRQDFIRSRGK